MKTTANILWTMIALGLGWPGLTATTRAATNAAPMTARELLDEFARTQDQLTRCACTVTTD